MKIYKAQEDGTAEPLEVNGLFAVSETITANRTLAADESGLEVNVGADALTIDLPAIDASNIGMTFLFRNIGADGNNIITVSPASTDAVHGTVANAAADSVASGVVNKDIINTKASANKGDYIVLTAVAETEWYITGGVGIWASEA